MTACVCIMNWYSYDKNAELQIFFTLEFKVKKKKFFIGGKINIEFFSG